MRHAVRQTRSYLMELFQRHGFNPRTDLGQNFLIDLNIIEYIVEHAYLTPNDVVLEVGAGTGGMTTFMAQDAGSVVSVELDSNMFMLASEMTNELDNVTLLNADALKSKSTINPLVLDTIQHELNREHSRELKLVANLPYNIATPLISNLVATEIPWSRMVVTIQLELAERMIAEPGTSDYGSLSVWLQAQTYPRLLKKLKPTVFWPRPKVNSAIVRLVPHPHGKETIADRPFFLDFLRRLFHQRRKLLRSVLVGMYRKDIAKSRIDEILSELEFPDQARAEETPVERHVELANRIFREIAAKQAQQEARKKAKKPQSPADD